MLVTLTRNSTAGNSGQVLVKAIADILSGAATTTATLIATYWTQASCNFDVGSYGTPTYWTIENDSSSNGASGTITLSCPSSIVGKKNFLQLCYFNTHQVYFQVGNGYSSGLLNPAEPYAFNNVSYTKSGIGNGSYPFVSSIIYVRFGPGFVNIWTPTFYSQVGGATWNFMFLGVEITNSAYDTYSTEGTFKGISFAGTGSTANVIYATMAVSNYYTPKTEAVVASKTWANVYNNWLSATTYNVGKSCTALGHLSFVQAPFIFNRLVDGWLGANVSAISGLYLTTCAPLGFTLANDDYIALGSSNYKVYAVPPATGGMSNNTFIMKL